MPSLQSTQDQLALAGVRSGIPIIGTPRTSFSTCEELAVDAMLLWISVAGGGGGAGGKFANTSSFSRVFHAASDAISAAPRIHQARRDGRVRLYSSSRSIAFSVGQAASREEGERLRQCVTVFGFAPADASYILSQFEVLGRVQRYQIGSPERDAQAARCNWMHLEYSTELEADAARGRDGKVFKDEIMIGVRPCISRAFVAEDGTAATWSRPAHQNASLFAPPSASLNVSQWVEAAVRGGFPVATLTTKHEAGFSIWPTKRGGIGSRMNPRERSEELSLALPERKSRMMLSKPSLLPPLRRETGSDPTPGTERGPSQAMARRMLAPL